MDQSDSLFHNLCPEFLALLVHPNHTPVVTCTAGRSDYLKVGDDPSSLVPHTSGQYLKVGDGPSSPVPHTSGQYLKAGDGCSNYLKVGDGRWIVHMLLSSVAPLQVARSCYILIVTLAVGVRKVVSIQSLHQHMNSGSHVNTSR